MTDNNPIAFNPDTMTVSELKQCADTLRHLFHWAQMDEHCSDEQLADMVRSNLRAMQKQTERGAR